MHWSQCSAAVPRKGIKCLCRSLSVTAGDSKYQGLEKPQGHMPCNSFPLYLRMMKRDGTLCKRTSYLADVLWQRGFRKEQV